MCRKAVNVQASTPFGACSWMTTPAQQISQNCQGLISQTPATQNRL
jgi:hypothetical protein